MNCGQEVCFQRLSQMESAPLQILWISPSILAVFLLFVVVLVEVGSSAGGEVTNKAML